jgi:hypothetical protein
MTTLGPRKNAGSAISPCGFFKLQRKINSQGLHKYVKSFIMKGEKYVKIYKNNV